MFLASIASEMFVVQQKGGHIEHYFNVIGYL